MRLRPIEHLENCKMHTQERQLTRFFCKKTEPAVLFKTELKPNQNRGFSQNRNQTELGKSIPHIPKFYPVICTLI